MGGQEPGKVQTTQYNNFILPDIEYEPKSDRGYSIVSGCGPGEDTLKAMERNCQNVPLDQIKNFNTQHE